MELEEEVSSRDVHPASDSSPNAVFLYDFRLSETVAPDPLALVQALPHFAKKWAFQLEQGDLTGYRHYQGKLTLIKKARLPQVLALFRQHQIFPVGYLAPSHSKKFDYVLKDQTRIAGPWDDRTTASFIPLRLRIEDADLRPWQRQLLELVEASDRFIDFIYCTTGNVGKSFLSLYLHAHGRAIRIPPVNDGERLCATVCDILMARESRDPGIIFLDCPRALEQKRMYGFYTALEEIKNGHVYDLRNRAREWMFNPPTIIVYSNQPPPIKLLSRDRWRLWQFTGDLLSPLAVSSEFLSEVPE